MRYLTIATSFLSIVFSQAVLAQTDTDLTLGHWDEHSWGLTLDRPLYEAQSDVHGDGTRPRDTAQIFWWDSTGRFRFSTSNPNAPTIGYRYVTMTLDTNAPTLPDTLDEVSLAGGLHLGEPFGGNLGVILGAGYSGDNLFADTDGIFGIGHLTWRRPIDEGHSFVLTLDYDGNRAFLPDVPLPGFAYESRGENFSYTFGYPTSTIDVRVAQPLTFWARYTVPFTADATLEYRFTKAVSVFTAYSSFLNGFVLDGESRDDRLFYRMQRVELGVRYINENFVLRGAYVDIALTGGYAFGQRFGRGFDARDIDDFASLSDVPYVGIVLRGRF